MMTIEMCSLKGFVSRATRVASLALLVPLLLAAGPLPSIEVTNTRFFAERIGEEGVVSVESDVIPFDPTNSCYRWEIEHRPQPGVRALRERLVLPAPAASWGGVDGNPDSPTRVAPRRDVAETELILPLNRGSLGSSWCVAEGDPRGPHLIEVFDGSRLLHRFEFSVE